MGRAPQLSPCPRDDYSELRSRKGEFFTDCLAAGGQQFFDDSQPRIIRRNGWLVRTSRKTVEIPGNQRGSSRMLTELPNEQAIAVGVGDTNFAGGHVVGIGHAEHDLASAVGTRLTAVGGAVSEPPLKQVFAERGHVM